MSGNSRKQEESVREARRLKVLQLTVAGGSSRAIAAQLAEEGFGSVSHTTVQEDLRKILGQMAAESHDQAENQRALMTERYNRLFLSWWGEAIGRTDAEGKSVSPPSGEAANKVLSILKAIRELNGLDVAVAQKLEHSGRDGGTLTQRLVVDWGDRRKT